ncbi:MAG TPA: Crp/Fnr family transcriptional regulator [Candidatus Saccharimonadales bacterium]|nr:Crp/Fnr family transcriptional regulator [Candidatus Saccharimonadales bacterium]
MSTETTITGQTATEMLAEFFRSGPLRTLDRKEVIASQFVNTDKLYLLETGYVKVVSYTGKGDSQIQHIYGPLEVFPLTHLSFVTEKPINFFKNLDFVALGDVAVREKHCTDFEAFICQKPEVLMALVAQQYFIFDRLYNISLTSASQRVIYRLLTLADRFGTKQDGHTLINLHITIQEIADTINVSRETTGRVLNELENKGFIMMSRKSLLVYTEPLKELLEENS